MKRCKHCGLMKRLEEFYGDAAARDGRRPECKACTALRRKRWYEANRAREVERVRQWQAANPERVKATREAAKADGRRKAQDRRSHLKRKYGITPEEYDEMLAAQGGGCAICGRPPREDIALHVDHDHGTGAIRGITCFRCNNALGDLNDDPKLLARAAQYLERHVEANDPEVQRAETRIRRRIKALSAG